MKERINIFKNFCSVKKNTVKRIKRQTTNWENIFAKDISNKGLSKTYKELLKHNNKKTNNPIKK